MKKTKQKKKKTESLSHYIATTQCLVCDSFRYLVILSGSKTNSLHDSTEMKVRFIQYSIDIASTPDLQYPFPLKTREKHSLAFFGLPLEGHQVLMYSKELRFLHLLLGTG